MIISKRHKIDIGLVSQALNNTNATGRYYHHTMWRRALAQLIGAAMAATKTTKIELLQATDASGTGAKAIAGAEATITANTSVTAATLTLATVLATHAVTINGVTFTGHADTTTAATREFAINGDDTADAAALAGLINDATYGVTGVTATAALGVITLTATDPGETAITIANAAATITAATTQAIAYVELDVAQLDVDAGFDYVAVKVTTTANTVVSVGLLRGEGRYGPEQVVGASALV